ncbi:MAG TPA: glutamate-5-semialdehyde dehydrogenase [Turneriella sp.]|nr:glutamate-5-semialdehyde dehydrogenase [Turneriella sp.]
MNEYITRIADNALEASQDLRQLSTGRKNAVLAELARLIQDNRKYLQTENARDIAFARETALEASLVDRLTLSEKVIDGMSRAALEIAALPDPVGEVIEGRTLANGVRLSKVRAPLGVVALIYESRPNVTVDVGALCLKSGNAAILRGGKEAIHSNRALLSLFHQALKSQGIPVEAVQLIEKTERALIIDLVKCTRQVDLVVPRGGEALIRFVTEHSLVPVVKHDKGVCSIYVAADAAFDMARDIVLNAKTQRPGVCNAAECLLVHKDWPHTAALLKALSDSSVVMHSDSRGIEWGAQHGARVERFLNDLGFGHEYLSLDISVRPVSGLDEAVRHILTWGSKHSEAIITNDYALAQSFVDALDSAAVFVNCSTRFHDGGEFGLGAEVGIATGKLHVRGPMGLRDLTTTRYIALGHGEIRR